MEENTIVTEDAKSENVLNELSNEQWEKAFSHPRFKELTAKAKELEKIKADLEKVEAKKLEENQEWKTLAEKFRTENETLKSGIIMSAKKQAIINQAIAHGVRKEALDDVIRLVDLEVVQYQDDKVTNAEDIIKNLVTNKPYLLSEVEKKTIGTSNISDNGAKSQFWKWSEIEKNSRDYKWYSENRAEIEKAKREGRINYKE